MKTRPFSIIGGLTLLGGLLLPVTASSQIPTIAGINPLRVPDTASVTVTFTGTNFVQGLDVRLVRTNLDDIVGHDVVVANASQVTAVFDVEAKPIGMWDVVLTNPGGAHARSHGFTVLTVPRPVSIEPARAPDSGPVAVTIQGARLAGELPTPRLRRSGEADVLGSSVTGTTENTTLFASFELLDRAPGWWDLVLQSPDGMEGVLPHAFEILAAPHVTRIEPDRGENVGPVDVKIVGRGFRDGATALLARYGDPDVIGTALTVEPGGESLGVRFDIAGLRPGFLDVVVRNDDGLDGAKLGGFEIKGAAIVYVVPNHGADGEVVPARITGSGFVSGATATIVCAGQPPIAGGASSVSHDGRTITTSFDLTGHAPQLCDLVVTNPNGSTSTLVRSFFIESSASASPSGLDLTWNACNRSSFPGADDITFDCTTPDHAVLYANFQPAHALPGFMTIDAWLDVRTSGSSLPAFWHLEQDGCNARGLTVYDDKPADKCPDADVASPWGPNGAAADPFITAYGVGFGGANRARLLVTVTRASIDPTTLIGGQNYFAFRLELSPEAAETCDGCSTPAEIGWSSATLYGVLSNQFPVEITGAGLRSNIVTLNGGPRTVAVAAVKPSRVAPIEHATLIIDGRNFLSGATAKLRRTGAADIVARSVAIAPDGRSVTADFDLATATSGLWDVVVTNLDLHLGTLPVGLEISADGPHVKISCPNGGERLVIGAPTTLEWNAVDADGVTGVDIELSRSGIGGPYERIVSGAPNAGSLPWNATGPPSANCWFRFIARDANGNTGEDVSDGRTTIVDRSTATQLARFDASWVDDGVEIRWQFAGAADLARVVLERSTAAVGPWFAVDPALRLLGEVSVVVDHAAASNTTQLYRLVATETSGETTVFGPIVVDPRATDPSLTSGITSVSPNPMSNTLQIGFAVAKRGAVRLSVLDVQGREVAVLIRGEQQAGRYQAVWDGRTTRGEAPEGVYFVRFALAGRVATRRVALAR